MTLHNHTYAKAHSVSPASCHWAGGSATIYTRRFFSNFRLPQIDMEVLHPGEKKRLEGNLHREKIHRSMAARAQLRRMLGQILRCDPRDVLLQSDAEGRPMLHPQYGAISRMLDFSVSYVPEGFAIGVTHQRRIGIDLQGFKPRQEASFERLFGSGFARRKVTTLEAHEVWTRMEAYGKMQGQGLGHGMHRLYRIALEPEIADINCHFLDFRFAHRVAMSICLTGEYQGPVCFLNH